jgi:hypothetical protein
MILMTGLVLLTGCAGTVYRTKLEIYCPPMAQYSPEYNQKLADEIDSLPAESTALETAIADYVTLRDRIRACDEEKDK